ncbi:MAG: (d)CMP kinase [Chitinivibrionales bacterium]|nr:(d)CMP kinase [Chitinivibrionales bacterium]MBD3358000.1 (d)CMP kinase [Chitinivibrionales bacterium]
MVIAIDGPAGSGKSSTARLVASRLGIVHLDTGAMYRAVTLKCLREGIAHTDDGALGVLMSRTSIVFEGSGSVMRTIMNGEDVTDAIRSDEVTRHVSEYCVPAVVRNALVEQQRLLGSRNSVVCEGRDIGTVVFPNAELKIYMIASVEERARRRQKDFAAMGIHKSLIELRAEIELRDRKDSTRSNSPLRKAEDALELDTTGLSLEEQAGIIVERARALSGTNDN